MGWFGRLALGIVAIHVGIGSAAFGAIMLASWLGVV